MPETYINKNAVASAGCQHQWGHAVDITKIDVGTVKPHQTQQSRQLTDTW